MRWSSGRGLGFSVYQRDGRTLVGHGGWVAGHRASIAFDPQSRIGVVVLTNCDVHDNWPPEAFAPGASVTVTIWEQDVPNPRVLVLSPELLERIRADLEPYFDTSGGGVRLGS